MSVFGFGRANVFKVVLVAAVAALLAACLLALVGMEKPAGATFPGGNGKIAFVTDRFTGNTTEIVTVNADGSNPTRLTNNATHEFGPDWSPDGTKIAFTTNRDGNDEIYVMNADGSNQTNLSNNTADDFHPSWSPDGAKIAFMSRRDGNDEIYVMNADGSDPTRLTNNTAQDVWPEWSPDGTKIAFTTNRDNKIQIYVMNADGSNQTNLTNNVGHDFHPSWSPDGAKIAFQTNRDGNDEIYVMNADGSNQTNLSNNAAHEQDPTWSPDGTKISFVTTREGLLKVYSMNADGSNQTRLTNTAGNEVDPTWQPLPDSTPPTLILPADITKEVTDTTGATVNYTATATDDRDGSVPISCSPASGSLFPIGPTQVNCSATDAAGNQASGSFQVKIVYDFGSGSGGSFGEPVRDTELNQMAAGGSVPVKFGLGADYGLNIFAAGYPTSKKIICSTGLPTDPVEETVATTKSGLTYDASTGLYTYVWKTERAWKGTCRELNLKLADGTDHPVKFQFK